MRNVGEESRKTYQEKLENGFFDKYMSGSGLDIGGRGYLKDVISILPTATMVDLDYPGYDGLTLPFSNNSQDYVYNSNVLEHIGDPYNAIGEWHRVTKIDGYIIIIVPHIDLYERKDELPSRWNGDHKRFYQTSSLIEEIENALPKNSYRIRHLRENDEGHDYNSPNDIHGKWLYETEIVLQKLS